MQLSLIMNTTQLRNPDIFQSDYNTLTTCAHDIIFSLKTVNWRLYVQVSDVISYVIASKYYNQMPYLKVSCATSINNG